MNDKNDENKSTTQKNDWLLHKSTTQAMDEKNIGGCEVT